MLNTIKKNLFCISAAMFIACSCSLLHAQQPRRLYLANDEHTDLMWTANVVQYDSAFVHMLDYYLAQIDSTSSNPDDFQTRFNCDGSYWLRAYEKYRSPRQYQRLVSRIRSGHISSPLNFLVSTYGGQPTEAVIRGMYPAGQLERDLKIRFPLAVAMENQTLPLGLSSLWAGSGARYSWRGVCGCATRFSTNSFAHRRNQLYRYTGLDGQSVIMKWYNLGASNKSLGGYAECRRETNPKDPLKDFGLVILDLENMCDTSSSQSKYPFNVAGAFGYGWDNLMTYNAPDFVNAARTFTNASRKVRVSNEVDFFEDVSRSYPELPAEKVSFGNEWDTYAASMNETTARVRRAVERLRSAEAMASVVALMHPRFNEALKPLQKEAWEAIGSYWEHDWTADGPVSRKDRARWQINLEEQISRYTYGLDYLSRNMLSNGIRQSSNPRLYVFNSLSWVRSELADFEYEGSAVRVIDLVTGKEVACQFVVKGNRKFLRFFAENIPSLGYKIYELRKGVPSARVAAADVQGEFISNKFFKLRVKASGAITEWYDNLASGRSLIKETDGRYVNDLGAKDLSSGTIVVENSGPVSVTLKAVSNDPVKHTVRITLFADLPRIEIEDSIQSNFKDLKTWAFSFNLERPTTQHEELGAILTVKKETRGGHYASQNARYDWLTFNHFSDLSESNYGITLSNLDCSFFKLGNSTADSLWENSSQLNALAGGQTDMIGGNSEKKDTTRLGIYNQNGQQDFLYHFALTSHADAFDPVKAMKFSLAHQNPLITGAVVGDSKQPASTSFSLLSMDNPGIVAWSVKPAEEGINNGLIVRLWNLNKVVTKTDIRTSFPMQSAWKTTHIETNERSLPVRGKDLTVEFQPHQLNTFRIIPAKRQ